jgi:hypothetical protein
MPENERELPCNQASTPCNHACTPCKEKYTPLCRVQSSEAFLKLRLIDGLEFTFRHEIGTVPFETRRRGDGVEVISNAGIQRHFPDPWEYHARQAYFDENGNLLQDMELSRSLMRMYNRSNISHEIVTNWLQFSWYIARHGRMDDRTIDSIAETIVTRVINILSYSEEMVPIPFELLYALENIGMHTCIHISPSWGIKRYLRDCCIDEVGVWDSKAPWDEPLISQPPWKKEIST